MRTILIAGYNGEINTMLAMLIWNQCNNPRIFTAESDEEAEYVFLSKAITCVVVCEYPSLLNPQLQHRVLFSRIREIGCDGPVIAASTDWMHNDFLHQVGCTHKVPIMPLSGSADVLAAASMAVALTGCRAEAA